MKGMECPACGKQTFHLASNGGHRECSSCHCVGWAWYDPVKDPGRGKGNMCWNCESQTLHVVASAGGCEVRRCSVCSYVTITPQ
jgi:hypothetical protein